MSLTIQLPGLLEQQIRDNAARQGVSLEKYVTDVLHYVAAWARLRDMSLRQAMSELGLKRYPDEH